MNPARRKSVPDRRSGWHRTRCARHARAQRRALRRDLRFILGEGAAHSVMVGVGESYLPAFVLAMGMGQVAAGSDHHDSADGRRRSCS